MLDEVRALLTGFVGYVDGGSSARCDACLEDGVVLGVDRNTRVSIVVTAWRNLWSHSPTGTSAIDAMYCLASRAVVSLSDDTILLDDHGAYLAP